MTDHADHAELPEPDLVIPDWLDDWVPPPEDRPVLPRVLTIREAVALGVATSTASHRARVGRWHRLAPGVYLTKPPPIRLDHLAAAALHGGPRAVVSGAAALADYGLPVRPPSQELVLVPLGCGARSGGRIVVRPTARLPEPELRPGPPLAPPARAIADHVLTARDLGAVQMVLGAAIQDDLCTVAELTAELAAGPRRGSRLFREALQDINHNAHSAQEARAGRLLRTAGVSGFEQNVKVPFGTRWFVADFLWRAERAILEIDSRQYHFRPEDQASTRRRDQLLQTDGWAVLHVAPSELRGAEGGRAFVTLVQRWLAALRRRGGLPTR